MVNNYRVLAKRIQAIAVLSITSIIFGCGQSENDLGAEDNHLPTTNENDSISNDSAVEFDDEGRAIVNLGDSVLHIPVEVRSPTTPTNKVVDLVLYSICWPDFEKFGRCNSDKSRISVYLQSRPITNYPHYDGNDVLKRATRIYDGPFETSQALVKEYRSKAGGDARLYFIGEEDETGRYPEARCDSIACRVDYLDRPGIQVTYRFFMDYIEDWQSIDRVVRNQIKSLTVDD